MLTLVELMESALEILSSWTTNCGLGSNPNKTDLILFSRRYKNETFRLPSLGGREVLLSSEVKYLDFVLDNQLNWKQNNEE